jgi:hypothetical protein
MPDVKLRGDKLRREHPPHVHGVCAQQIGLDLCLDGKRWICPPRIVQIQVFQDGYVTRGDEGLAILIRPEAQGQTAATRLEADVPEGITNVVFFGSQLIDERFIRCCYPYRRSLPKAKKTSRCDSRPMKTEQPAASLTAESSAAEIHFRFHDFSGHRSIRAQVF